MSLDRQFKKIVSVSFADLSLEEFKNVALAVWYENYTPNLTDMMLDERQKAGYLIDRLMRFNCVSDKRKLQLMEFVREAKSSLPKELITVSSSTNVEPLARKWNLEEDVSAAIQPLLKYQTRHYVHSKTVA